MEESIRSFLAFDIDSDEILQNFARIQDSLRKTGADLGVVEPRNIHVTMRFLGNIRPATVEKIHEEMKTLRFTAFDIMIAGIGAFPNARRPRVVWAGITDGADQLQNIFNQLEPKLQNLGFASEPRGFSPHLTMARVKSSRNQNELVDLIRENASFQFGIIRAICLRLKKSVLTPRGPIYSTLREFCP